MRVLVTGASGHVGGTIAAQLSANGHHVAAIGRRRLKTPGLEESAVVDLARPGAAYAARVALQPCAAIVHAAASLDKSPHSVALSLTNGLGTQEMLRLAEAWNSERFIFISGVPVVGRPAQLPVTETHSTAPSSAYLASKLYGEHLTALATERGIPSVSLRLTSPVGPGMPAGRILSVFVQRALAGEPLELAGEGSRRQDYVDVRDVARAVGTSLTSNITGILNIAAGRSTSNRELAEACIAVSGSHAPVRLSGQPDPEEGVAWEVSIARAAERIGYAPQYSLEDSIRTVAESSPMTRLRSSR